MDKHLATIWESIADAIGDEVALIHGDRTVTWAEFDDRSARLATAFTASGLTPGSVIAIDMYNCPEFFEVFYAAIKADLVPTMINYRYRERELRYLLDDSGTAIVVAHPELGERVRAAATGSTTLASVVDVGDDYEDLVAAHDPAPRRVRDPQGMMLSYTGGTTGMPKGVMYGMPRMAFQVLNTRGLICGIDVDAGAEPVDVAVDLLHRNERPVVCPASPLMHSTGFTFASLPALTMGGSVATLEMRHFDAPALLDAFERHRVTATGIVGDAFGRPIVTALDERRAAGQPFDASNLRVVCSAGVAFSADTKRRLFEHVPQLTIVDACGSTEGATFGISIVRAGDDLSTARFQPAPGTIVLADDGTEAPVGTVGLISAVTVTRGYYNHPEETAESFHVRDGETHVTPGDFGRIEPDGSLTLLGRGTSVINTGGEKVHPEEVEDAIKTIPGVVDAVVTSIPDERLGQVVGAVIQLAPDTAITPSDVTEHVRSQLAGYKAPRQVAFTDAIPRGPNGKLDVALARQILAGEVARVS